MEEKIRHCFAVFESQQLIIIMMLLCRVVLY